MIRRIDIHIAFLSCVVGVICFVGAWVSSHPALWSLASPLFFQPMIIIRSFDKRRNNGGEWPWAYFITNEIVVSLLPAMGYFVLICLK